VDALTPYALRFYPVKVSVVQNTCRTVYAWRKWNVHVGSSCARSGRSVRRLRLLVRCRCKPSFQLGGPDSVGLLRGRPGDHDRAILASASECERGQSRETPLPGEVGLAVTGGRHD